MMTRVTRWLVACALLPCLPASLAAVDHWPECTAPQAMTPARPIMPYTAASSAIAWNGKDFAIAFAYSGLRFQRFYADGTPVAPPVSVGAASPLSNRPVAMAWSGNNYGVAWTEYVQGFYQVMFAQLDENGRIVAGPTRLSFYGQTPTADAYTSAMSVAWGGNDLFYVTWYDWRNGNADVFLAVIGGTIVWAHDAPIVTAAHDQTNPSIVWSRGGNIFIVAWQDVRSGTHSEIWTATIDNWPTVHANPAAVISAAGDATEPMLADSGTGIGMAWTDTRDGNREIYAGVLNATNGTRYAGPTRVTSDTGISQSPVVVATGAEYGLFWRDTRISGTTSDVWFQRVSATGGLAGSSYQVSAGLAVDYVRAAFGAHGYMASYNGDGQRLMLQPWGCSSPGIPACPDGLNAYSISTSAATLGWLPVNDLYTDTAYYRVYRNGSQVGMTNNTSFSDTGLSANTTYQYDVQTVNAAANPSGSCAGARIWVKATASLSLAVAKSGPDIALSWQGAGQSTYRVLRGTSPQALTEIGRTTATSASDPGAAQGPTCWFYSIDPPM